MRGKRRTPGQGGEDVRVKSGAAPLREARSVASARPWLEHVPFRPNRSEREML